MKIFIRVTGSIVGLSMLIMGGWLIIQPVQDSLLEVLNSVSCNTLDDEALSEHCRARGIYPHHHWCLRHWWYCRTALSFDERKSLLLT